MMKNCIQCGTGASSDALECSACRRPFAYVDGSPDTAVKMIERTCRTRPDGGALLGGGGLCLILGLVAFAVAVSQESSGYYRPDVDALARQWIWTLIAGGLFQLGLVLLLTGTIVRAIWFLPGEAHKAAPETRSFEAFEERLGMPGTRPGDDGAVV